MNWAKVDRLLFRRNLHFVEHVRVAGQQLRADNVGKKTGYGKCHGRAKHEDFINCGECAGFAARTNVAGPQCILQVEDLATQLTAQRRYISLRSQSAFHDIMRPTPPTTVMGLLPSVLMPGEGSELYRGLGGVVLGGLVVSTLFTLVLVPTVFSLMLEAQAKLIQRLDRSSDATSTLDDVLDPPSELPISSRVDD